MSSVVITGVIIDYTTKDEPTALDVYQGKTTLEYKVVDGIKIDSIVIFKDSIYER